MGGMWISLVVPGVVVVVVAVVEVGIPEAAAVVTASVMNVGSLATLPGSVGCSEVMEVREAEGVEVPVLNIEEAQVMDAGAIVPKTEGHIDIAAIHLAVAVAYAGHRHLNAEPLLMLMGMYLDRYLLLSKLSKN
ncbi:hypothetical protein ACMD2_14417 [Ananas comosus]|uniref:Uncharacterized protein n=1 Tax=Ananas comosus TaxID=4615 RepID=A0A199W9G0_ANACO|nr:hypothetical protein ACMD2_14417 [Ananas comosus]